jgi:hypothetical protein
MPVRCCSPRPPGRSGWTGNCPRRCGRGCARWRYTTRGSPAGLGDLGRDRRGLSGRYRPGLSCFTISGTFLSNYLARLTPLLTTRSMRLPARMRQRPFLGPDTRSDLVPFSADKTCQIIRRSTPAAHESAAVTSTGSRLCPTWRPAAIRPHPHNRSRAPGRVASHSLSRSLAQVGGQPRQPDGDVAVPADRGGHGEGVSQVVDPRSRHSTPGRGLLVPERPTYQWCWRTECNSGGCARHFRVYR